MNRENMEKGRAEFQGLIQDVSGNPYLRGLRGYPGHKLFNNSSGRLRHSYAVAWLSYLLAKRLGLDPALAARAGLLHDIGYTRGEGLLRNFLCHARRGAARARDMGEKEEVCEVISRHMFPFTLPPASKHGWLVWIADKTASVLELLGLEKRLW